MVGLPLANYLRFWCSSCQVCLTPCPYATMDISISQKEHSKQPQLGQGRGDQCSPRHYYHLGLCKLGGTGVSESTLPRKLTALSSATAPPSGSGSEAGGTQLVLTKAIISPSHLRLPWAAPAAGHHLFPSTFPTPPLPVPSASSILLSSPSHLPCWDPRQATVISSLGLCKHLPWHSSLHSPAGL